MNKQPKLVSDVSERIDSLPGGSVPPRTLCQSGTLFIAHSIVAKPFGAVCALALLKFAKY